MVAENLETGSNVDTLASQLVTEAEERAFNVHWQHVIITRTDVDKIFESSGPWRGRESVRNAAYMILESRKRPKSSRSPVRRTPRFPI